MAGTRILCTGDLHLGRSPTKIPDLPGAEGFTPRVVLKKCVDLARRLEAEIFVFTGDVVDESNAFIEAYSALAAGIKDLIDSGIRVFAIAGNHDFHVLPKLNEEIPEFRLLGNGKGWEEEIVQLEGDRTLRVQGRSFTGSHSTENPIHDYQPPQDDIPTVAVVHCDVDVPGSFYGPVTLAELRQKAPTAWLLGHVHRPNLFQDNPCILYPGSPQGMDPGETGPHGPWLLRIEGKHSVSATHYPVAPLRYERIDVSLEEAEEESDVQQLVVGALKTWQQGNQEALSETRLVCARIALKGRTAVYQAASRVAQGLLKEPVVDLERVRFYIEKVVVECEPKLSLEDLSRHQDHVGMLARKLKVIREGDPGEEYHTLLSKARREMERTQGTLWTLAPEHVGELDENTVRRNYLRAGMFVLAELLKQKGDIA